MNEENSSGLEFDPEELEESSDNLLGNNAQSRARNRTVMLTPEMTGEVRSILKTEDSAAADDDFLRPGQKSKSEEDVVIPPMVTPERITGGLGLNFGRSTNRAETTRFSREELDRAIGLNSESKDLISEAVTAQSIPVVESKAVESETKESLAFNPLTTLAPSNGSAFLKSPGQPKPRTQPAERQAPKIKQPEPRQAPAANMSSVVSSRPVENLEKEVSVTKSAAVKPAPKEVAPKKPTSKIVGFLVSYDETEFGEVFQIRAGRKLITSRPTDHGEYMLINDKTVSPLHAILRATKDGKVQVLDQLSEHGTAVIKKGEKEETEITGGLEEVNDGDTIRFGERTFEVCLISKS